MNGPNGPMPGRVSNRGLCTVIATVVGAGFFTWIAGTRVLDPSDVGWLQHYDWRWNFLGWHFFRHEPWHVPPGRIATEFFPAGTALGYTDSIPLAAFALKPLAFALPGIFQYVGLWLLLCYGLQGACAVQLFAEWSRSRAVVLTGSALVILNPVLLHRVKHAALCSHWLLLLGFLLYFRGYRGRSAVAAWAALAFAASLIHPYLSMMVAGLAIAAAARAVLRRDWRLGTLTVLAVLATSVLGAWSTGLFLIPGSKTAAEGFGELSMNLLGLVAANGWSALLPNVPISEWQAAEGFNYLGAGAIAVVLVAIVECARRPPRLATIALVGPLAFVCVAFAAFSLSNRVTIGPHLVAIIPLPDRLEEILGATRATGRFFWPAGYFVVLLSIAVIARRYPPAYASVLLFAAIALQMYDLAPTFATMRTNRSRSSFYAWRDLSQEPEWRAVTGQHHMVIVLPEECGAAPAPYWPLGVFAGRNAMTFNAGQAARIDSAAMSSACGALVTSLASGHLDPDTIYVLHPAEVERLRTTTKVRLRCWPYDAATACIVDRNTSVP